MNRMSMLPDTTFIDSSPFIVSVWNNGSVFGDVDNRYIEYMNSRDGQKTLEKLKPRFIEICSKYDRAPNTQQTKVEMANDLSRLLKETMVECDLTSLWLEQQKVNNGTRF